MKHWLIVYDRQAGRMFAPPKQFTDPQFALRARFAVEKIHPELEVVVLGAESIDQLKVTHSRYFGGPYSASVAAPQA